MTKGMICQDCGAKFSGHGNRTRCKSCQIKNSEWVIDQRTEFDHIKGKVKRRDGNRCAACGSTAKLTVHHVIPVIKGGCSDLSNLITLCFKCHMKAHHG